jgi:hypothetical protein
LQDDQASPLLAFIDTLMTRGRLDAPESAELAQLVLAQNKKHLLDNWLLKEARDWLPCPQCCTGTALSYPGVMCLDSLIIETLKIL